MAASYCSPQSHLLEPNASPVKHSEWSLANTDFPSLISPLTKATWCSPFSLFTKPYILKSPYFVGILISTTLSTSFSFVLLYATKSAIVIILRWCSFANSINSGVLAIVPSLLIISHITPAGFNPASFGKSTAASVCPTRFKTPPDLAISGNICPGLLNSLESLDSKTFFIVNALS